MFSELRKLRQIDACLFKALAFRCFSFIHNLYSDADPFSGARYSKTIMNDGDEFG